MSGLEFAEVIDENNYPALLPYLKQVENLFVQSFNSLIPSYRSTEDRVKSRMKNNVDRAIGQSLGA